MELITTKTFKDKCDAILAAGLCLSCFESAKQKCKTLSEEKEYKISGFCGECFSKMLDSKIEGHCI